MPVSPPATGQLSIAPLVTLIAMTSWIGLASCQLIAQEQSAANAPQEKRAVGEIPATIQVGDRNLAIVGERRREVTPQRLIQATADDDPAELAAPGSYQPIDLSSFADSIHHWQMKDGRGRNDARFQPDQIVLIAENLLKFQNNDGGWPTNLDPLAKIDIAEITKLRNGTIGRSSFDNRNTYSQIEYLMQVFRQTGLPKFQASAVRGLNYILQQQRPSGGWRGNDVDAITFNDDVMVGIMRLLLKIRQGDPPFDSLDPELKARLSAALDPAIDVTLKCQITVDGIKTAWCQQHDHLTQQPIQART